MHRFPIFGVKGNTASKITSVLGAGKCVRVPPRSKNPSVATKCLEQGYINRYNLSIVDIKTCVRGKEVPQFYLLLYKVYILP